MNSTPVHWYMRQNFGKYRSGYLLIEVGALKKVPIPNPASIKSGAMMPLMELIDQRMSINDNPNLDQEIDRLIMDAYGVEKSDFDYMIGGEID